jgi:hypothetical protein
LDGEDSRSMDISNGGEVTISNSVIEKGPNSQNNDLIGYGPEGLNTAYTHTFTMTGTTVIEDRGNGPAIDFYKMPSSITITGNTFIGPDAIANAGDTSNNIKYASRAAAGMQAFPYLPSAGSASPSPSPTTTNANWVKCASEGGTCAFSGTHTVRYGTGTSWITKVATGSIACNNTTFGSDPAYGKVKECDVDLSSPPSASPSPTASASVTPSPTATATLTWVKCASEGGTCTFSGTKTVRYGTGTKWTSKVVTGSIGCNNTAFGGDPAYGYVKECDVAQ